MRIACFTSIDQLAPYSEQWDRLSGEVPFRTWTWLSRWWRHYGGGDEPGKRQPRLLVPCLLDEGDALVAALPCYLDCRGPQGRILQLLGSGEICSDYGGLLCDPHRIEPATESLAEWFTSPALPGGPPHWDLLAISGFDVGDTATSRLLEQLAAHGCTVHRRTGPNCWRVALPADWDKYLAQLSKSHRKQVRRHERSAFESGRAVLHTVRQLDEIPQAMGHLIDLHQRRRQSLGQAGCFASPRFAAFHGDVMGPLLSEGRLQLHWLELDGRPAAADYHLSGNGVIYAYQGGMAPDLVDEEPGALMTIATLRRAIEQGYHTFDFLRGDEPYKAHWRARPRPTLEIRVAANRVGARFRQGLWLAGLRVKRLFQVAETPDMCRG